MVQLACWKKMFTTGIRGKMCHWHVEKFDIFNPLIFWSEIFYIAAEYSEYTRALTLENLCYSHLRRRIHVLPYVSLYTRAVTFQNLCSRGFWRATVSHIRKNDLLQCQKRPINSSHIQWLLARYGVTGLNEHAVSCHDLFAAYKKARVNWFFNLN